MVVGCGFDVYLFYLHCIGDWWCLEGRRALDRRRVTHSTNFDVSDELRCSSQPTTAVSGNDYSTVAVLPSWGVNTIQYKVDDIMKLDEEQ